jgi:integrase
MTEHNGADKDKQKRRGRNEGSIRERPDTGVWEGRISYIDGEGKRQRPTVTGATKKEAQKKLDALRQRASNGVQYLEADKMTLASYLDGWLERCKSSVSPNTYLQYEQHTRLYLKPLLGQLPLGKVIAHSVEQLFVKLHSLGLTLKQQGKVGTTLSAALGKAVKKGLLQRNPCEHAEWPMPDDPNKVKAYTKDQVGALLKAAQADRLYAMYVLSLDAGLRQEEAFALEWPDVDFTAGTVRVHTALEEISLKKRADIGRTETAVGRFRIKSIKTKKGSRTLPLAPHTVAVLRQHRDHMTAEGHGSRIVFCDTGGGYLRKSNVRRRSLLPVLARAGLPNYGSHGMRHTCATLLLLDGVNIKVVSERLGHSTVVLTLQTYVHVLPGMQDAAAEKVEGWFRTLLPPATAATTKDEIGHGQATAGS